MQNIFDIHDYDDSFLERFTKNIIPIYDLWSIRPLQNDTKILLSGKSNDVDEFRDFISDHAGTEIPFPLLIMIGNAEKTNPNNFLSNKKNYYKLKFESSFSSDIGTPLVLNGYPQGNEQMQSFPFAGYGQPNQQNQFGANPQMSYTDIQGIVDKNVSDATRSIRAEYDEVSAKREIDSYKQMAALETKMEMYKLDMKANEIAEKERKFNEDQDSFEEEKLEGLGNVKDYTKTIAGGLLELGKSFFGIEDFEEKNTKKAKDSKAKSKENKSDLKGSTTTFDDDGFTSKETNTETQSNNQNTFSDLMGVIGNLDEEEKYKLLNVLIPEEEQEPAPKEIEQNNEQTVIEKENTEETNQKIKTKKDENIQSDNND